MTEPKQRRALSSLEPPSKREAFVAGAQGLADTLFEALVTAAETESDTLTHGFHTYPARLHAGVAGTLIDALVRDGRAGHVVDPFCGSGTVLIEAQRRGVSSLGIDVNPIALRVARVKCDVRTNASIDAFLKRLDVVVEKSKERVRARAPGRAPVSPAMVKKFEGHVLRELAGLLEEIRRVDDEKDRNALEVVLSAIIVKVSKQRA